MKLSLVLLVFLVSCFSRVNILENSDRCTIFYINNGDTLIHEDKNKQFIHSFGEALNAPDERISCEPSGIIHFFMEDTLIEKIYFSTTETGGDEKCEYAFHRGTGLGRRLTYQAGRYLDEIYNTLRKGQ